ncbi:hypothetical protein OROHE_018153 [Orobanche hederae]
MPYVTDSVEDLQLCCEDGVRHRGMTKATRHSSDTSPELFGVHVAWPSQEILKIRDCTPLEAEEILIYIKSPRNGLVWHFSSKLDVPSNIVQKKRVARILFFKIRTSEEILKVCDGTPLEAEEILTYIKKPSKWIDLALF